MLKKYKTSPSLFIKEILNTKDIEFRIAKEEEEWDEGGVHYINFKKGDAYLIFYNRVEERATGLIKKFIEKFDRPVVLNDYIAITRFDWEKYKNILEGGLKIW